MWSQLDSGGVSLIAAFLSRARMRACACGYGTPLQHLWARASLGMVETKAPACTLQLHPHIVAQGVVAQAKAQLLTLSLELKYTNSTNATISGLADQIAAAPQEALIMCGLASESADMVRAIDARRKPLKSIVMTGGAYAR